MKTKLPRAIEQRFSHIYTESLFFLATVLDPRYKDCFYDQATKREATKALKDKVRCAASAENVEEPNEKKTETTTDGNNNVSLLTVYEKILQENNTKELNQRQTDPI